MSHRESVPTTVHRIGRAFRRGWSRALIIGLMAVFALEWLTAGVLHGQAADEALVIDNQGRVGIGTPTPQTTLDVAGATSLGGPLKVTGATSLGGPVTVTGKGDTVGEVSLHLTSGNSGASHLSHQMTFGYKGTDTYRHSIRTRHHGGLVTNNAIDFYVWDQARNGGDSSKIGGLHTMTLDGGRVGIGTTDPQFTLDVKGPTSLGGTLSVANATTLKDTLRVEKNAAVAGNLSATQVTASALTVNGEVTAASVNARDALSLRTKNVDRLVIRDNAIDLPNGWSIATTADRLFFKRRGADIMILNNGERLQYNVPGIGVYYLGRHNSGPPGTSSWWATWDSDRRLKTDVEPIASALEKVGRLRGVVYRWSEDAQDRLLHDMAPTAPAGSGSEARAAQERARISEQLARPQIGLIAQEVESVVPEVVSSNAEGYKGIQYGHLAALLVEAVKEQRALVQAQRTEIEALKASNADPRGQVHELQALRAAARAASAEIADMRAQLAQLGAAVQRVTTTRAAARQEAAW